MGSGLQPYVNRILAQRGRGVKSVSSGLHDYPELLGGFAEAGYPFGEKTLSGMALLISYALDGIEAW
jgi:hypothetical protein